MIALLAAAVLLGGAQDQVTVVGRQPQGEVYSGRASQLRVRPPRFEETGTAVDGRLDEPQWTRAALLTGFSQFSPRDGAAAEDSTEVLV